MPIESQLSMDLEKGSLRSKITKEVRTLANIRNEINEFEIDNIDKKKKDEYLSGIERLSKNIESIIIDSTLKADANIMIKSFRDNPTTLAFDAKHINFWEKQEPDFVKSLERLTITTLGEYYQTRDSMHHICQAIKFLGVASTDFATKDRVYSTILPMSKMTNETRKKTGLSESITRLLGYSYEILEDNGHTIRVKGDIKYINPLLKKVKEQGYSFLELEISEQKALMLTKQIEGSEIKNIENKVKKDLATGYDADDKFRKISDLKGLLIGALPASMQKRITENEGINPSESYKFTRYSSFVQGLLGVMAIAAGTVTSTPIVAITGSYFLTEAVIRANLELEAGSYVREKFTGGTLPLVIALYPVEVAMQYMEQNKPSHNLRIPLGNSSKSLNDSQTNKAEEYIELSKLAQLEIPQFALDNLEWSPSNHNNFGEDFKKEIGDSIKRSSSEFEQLVDRENQKFTLIYSQTIGPHKKISALSYGKENRYLTSMITKSDITSEEFAKEFNKISLQPTNTAGKLKILASKFKIDYAHMTKYDLSVPMESFAIF